MRDPYALSNELIESRDNSIRKSVSYRLMLIDGPMHEDTNHGTPNEETDDGDENDSECLTIHVFKEDKHVKKK